MISTFYSRTIYCVKIVSKNMACDVVICLNSCSWLFGDRKTKTPHNSMNYKGFRMWAHRDLNPEPTDYESSVHFIYALLNKALRSVMNTASPLCPQFVHFECLLGSSHRHA